MSEASTQIGRARIDRGTAVITLPVPKGQSRVAIQGQWGDEDHGPEATLVSLTCRTRHASRNSEHRLIRDTSFPLPLDTESIGLRVLASCPGTSLSVTVTTVPPSPNPYTRRAIDHNSGGQ